MSLPPVSRLPLLFLGMASLVLGVLAGLARLDWPVPALAAQAAGNHAPLMISAFFGTVISLERAVALARPWAYAAPGLAGLGGILLVAGAPHPLPLALSLAAAAVMVAASLLVVRRQTAVFTVVLLLGACCWLAGNGIWGLAGPAAAIPWWLAFLVLTIAGERLELTRFLPTPPRARRLFLAIVAVLLAGAALGLAREKVGLGVFAGSLLALALWLVRYDIARPNARQQGLTRFIAVCLLSGYGWLALAGFLGLLGGFGAGHPLRDAALHAVGLGFVFAMVFGHAPIIFPAVTRLKIPYHPAFYLPLLLLHLSLALRVAGSLGQDMAWRSQGGLINGLALLFFILTMVAGAWRGKRQA